MALALLATPVGAMAADQQPAGQEIKEALSAIKDYTIEQKDAAVAEGQKLLDRVGTWAEQAGAKASDAAEEGRQATAARLKELRARANERFQALQRSSAAAWEDAKREFTEAIDELRHALDDSDNKAT